MTVAIQTGLRVSELTALRCQDVHLAAGAHVQTVGKGRKQRATPLTANTVSMLRAWQRERNGQPGQPLFPTSGGRPLGRDAVALLLAKHATTASNDCATLKNKSVSPHVLRHTAAMNLLHAGADGTVIALWLGHESIEATQIYLHADMAIKERAIARAAPPNSTPGRYRPNDILLAFFESLDSCRGVGPCLRRPTRAVLALRDRLVADGMELVEHCDEPDYVSVKRRDPDGYIVEASWEPER
jgi:integrase/recombinase XerD